VTKPAVDELDVIGAATVAGRSAETVRRWVWSGRLRARKRGNKLLIDRAELERLLQSSDARKTVTLADWLSGLERSGLKAGASAGSAADLVLADRRARAQES